MARAHTGYSLAQIILHWMIAGLIAFQFLLHEPMEEAFDDIVDGDYAGTGDLNGAWLHASIGLTVLGLAVIRLILRLSRGAPPAHRDKPAFLIWIAHATHFALYAFIFAMPIVGAIAWFGLIEDAGDLHGAAASLLLPLIGLHIAGALAEHFFFRNDTLKRMIVPEGRTETDAQSSGNRPREA